MTQPLFPTDANPLPPLGEAGHLAMRDGKRIRYARFTAEGRPLKGTVVIIPGRNECIEKYFETIGDLSRRGFGTAIFDLRGQGGSDRLLRDPERGYIDDFQRYVEDLEPFFQQVVLPDCRGPYYVLAHSTGALIALLGAEGLANRVQRMVLTAPLIAFANQPMDRARRISGLLVALGLGRMYLGGGRRGEATPFDRNVLTGDRARYARNVTIYEKHPRLALGGPTAGWVHAACRASEAIRSDEFMTRFSVPTLFVAAGADAVVDTPAIERYATSLRAGSLVTIDGARHEILQETDRFREQFFAAFDAFIPGSTTG